MNKNKCKWCQGVFTSCSTCNNTKTYYGYRKDFCSPNCFQKFMSGDNMDIIEKVIDGRSIKGRIRGKIFDQDQMVEIINYEFNEPKGKFVDHLGEERNIYDFQYMYIEQKILLDILQHVYNQGKEQGRKQR